jgi:hypothetical protein
MLSTVKLKDAGEHTFMTDATRLHGITTRRTENPSNFHKTKIQIGRIILPGFLLKLNRVTHFAFL